MGGWAYFDTSCLVKIFVRETGSDACRRGFRDADRVGTSVVTFVETCMVLARKVQSNVLKIAQADTIRGMLEHTLIPDMAIVGIPDIHANVVTVSGRLSAKYPLLRALDAIHLASAMALRVRAHQPRIGFYCADDRLRSAAEGEGFNVLP